MNLAKVNTAKTVLIGPVLDADGVAVTGLSASSFKITKNGTVGDLNGSSTVTHNHTGHYLYAANAGDLDTLGDATISINSTTNGMAPVSLQVVTANIYDTFCSTDKLEVDLLQIGGDAQSATDIKDFADAGYDPSTNKVQGVVLVDTCTTNTDMRGTDSAALASVCTDTRLSELDAGTAGKMANQVDEIRTDTEDIQSKIGTPNGASMSADIADIPTVSEFEARTIAAADYTIVSDLPTVSGIADGVWDEALSGHTGAGSAGLALATASSGGVDPSVLADAIWDEALSGHSTAGTTGKKLTDLVNADLSSLATSAEISALNDITVADIIAGIADGTYDLQEMMRIMFSVLAGKASGGGTATLTFRDSADSKDRVTATVDANGNRTAITLDGA